MPIVNVPDIGLVNFPDEMPSADIESAIKNKLQPPEPSLPADKTISEPPDLTDTPEARSAELARPVVTGQGGEQMTVKSIGVSDDQGSWVIPTIVNGQEVPEKTAIDLWKQGKNPPLNKKPLPSDQAADQWAQQFHEAEAQRIAPNGNWLTSNAKRIGASVAEGAASGWGSMETAGARLLDVLSGASTTGYGRLAPDAQELYKGISDSFQKTALDSKGNEPLFGLASFAGAFAPIALASFVGGPAGAVSAFLGQGYENTREGAEAYLNKIRPDSPEQNASDANKAGWLGGTVSAALAHYIHAVPGANKLGEKAINDWITKLTATQLGEGAVKIGLPNIISQAAADALSQGAFTAGDLAVAKATYDPDLTFTQAGQKILQSASGAAIFGGGVRSLKEGYRGATGYYPKLGEAKAALDQQRAAAEAPATEAFQGTRSVNLVDTQGPGASLPHVNDFANRMVLQDGQRIGVITGSDAIGLTVRYDGQLRDSTVPYAAFGLKPGVNVRTEPVSQPAPIVSETPAIVSPAAPVVSQTAPIVPKPVTPVTSTLEVPNAIPVQTADEVRLRNEAALGGKVGEGNAQPEVAPAPSQPAPIPQTPRGPKKVGLRRPVAEPETDPVWKQKTSRFMDTGYADAVLGPVTSVKLSDIEPSQEHASTQPGIVKAFQEGKPVPPVVLEKYDDGTIRIVDGSHRVNSAEEAGVASLSARFVKYADGLSWDQANAKELAKPAPTAEAPTTSPKPVTGDWIEWTDEYGKVRQGKVNAVFQVGKFIPGRGAEPPKTEYATDVGTAREAQNPKIIPEPSVARPAEYGASNKLVTRDQYEEIKKKLRAKLGQTNTIDPEIISLGTQLAVYHAEAGARKFADFSKAILADIGEGIRPYLKSIYSAVRDYPGMNETDFDTREEVERQISKPAILIAAPTVKGATPDNSQRLADWVREKINNISPFDWRELFSKADEAFGGTQAEGHFTPKDAYDAMELGINQFILRHPAHFDVRADPLKARENVESLKRLLEKLPTQTKRTAEQDEFQQFSTPPTLAYVAAWLAKLSHQDSVLEPSAGTGGIAVFAKNAGATVYGNELSPRRRGLLEKLGLDRVFGENAEQLNNILPADIKPTVVLMNPPFSSTAGRMQGVRNTSNATAHLEQALARLQPGGRLVAIVGEGMAMDRPTFRDWWSKIQGQYDVKANVGISGEEYAKYGTTFDNQIVVIDKTGPTKSPVISKVQKIEDLIPLLDGVRNQRTYEATSQTPAEAPGRPAPAQPRPAQPSGKAVVGIRRPKGGSQPAPQLPTDALGAGQREGTTQERPGSEPSTGPAGRPAAETGNVIPAPDRGPEVGEPTGAAEPEPAKQPEPGGSGGEAPGAAGQPGVGSGGKLVGGTETLADEAKIDPNVVFEDYRPQVQLPGGQPHPTPLAESAAMASVRYPVPKYKAKLPNDLITEGKLSDAQLENVLLAGQAHQLILPNGERRGYFIGDGCVAGETKIYDPITKKETAIKELCEQGKPITVLSLTRFGFVPARASAPFRKGFEDLFEVRLESGNKIKVTGNHKFLTSRGWLRVCDGLQPGCWLVSAQDHQERNLESYQSAHGEDAPHCSERPEDYLADCLIDYPSFRDEQLHRESENGQAASPSRADAHERIRPLSHTGDRGTLSARSHQHRCSVPRSKNNSSPASSRGPLLISDSAGAMRVRSMKWKPRASPLSEPGKVQQLDSVSSILGHQLEIASDSSQRASELVLQAALKHHLPSERKRQIERLSEPCSIRFCKDYGSFQNRRSGSTCDAFSSLFHSRWDRIVSIDFVRSDWFYDMTVPGTENYLAEGIVNHNTGVGKGRQIAAIIYDNLNRGNKKAIWISKNDSLANDARRDMDDLGVPLPIVEQRKHKLDKNAPIEDKTGVLFSNYRKLSMDNEKKAGPENSITRWEQIANWAGKDFDGVLVFDEAHQMGNAIDTKGTRGKKAASEMAKAAIELQRALPNAKVVYVSATGATELSNLAYAERLGIWGDQTPFADRSAFINQVSGGGVAAMEAVAKDLKSMGLYLARSLSFAGVNQSKVEQTLTPDQRTMYDAFADAWQVVLRNINAALDLTGRDGRGRGNATGQFWGAHLRFFNQILTTLQMPEMLRQMKADLDRNESVVIQLVNTHEAAQERAAAQAVEDDTPLEELDITPRDILMQLVDKSFPVNQFEQYTDENGNERSRMVVDSAGNPVLNQEAVALKEALMQRLGALNVPQGPLDLLVDHFGPENISEVTGRGRRLIWKETPEGRKRVWEDRGEKANQADMKAFADKKKRVLVFSDAGGTGASYHADKRFVNQEKRNHYVAQPGWRADNAIQGLGRSHRSNQAVPPEFKLVTTDLPGQKRFISTIARRIEQLGALTKGQRETAGQGMFDARDNLESSYAKEGLRTFLRDIASNRVEGISAKDFEEQTGLSLNDSDGAFVGDKIEIRQFLNRLLSLKTDMQDRVFREFSQRLDSVIEYHRSNGTLDQGMETLTAQHTRVKSDTPIWVDPKIGTTTRLVTLELTHPTKFSNWSDSWLRGFDFVRNTQSGRIWKLGAERTRANADGTQEAYRTAENPFGRFQAFTGAGKNLEVVPPGEAKALWESEIAKAPKTYTEDAHMITGTILPIWDRIGQVRRIVRAQTDDGKRFLGMWQPESALEGIRRNFGVETGEQTTPEQAVSAIMDRGATAQLANGWRLSRRMVSGQDRIELTGPSYEHQGELTRAGLIAERIGFKTRYFIPTGPNAVSIFDRITQTRPVVSLSGGERQSLAPEQPGEPRILTDEARAIVQKVLDKSGVRVNLVNEPDRKDANGALIQGWYKNGEIFVNAAHISDPAELTRVVKEEINHQLLDSVEGSEAIWKFAMERMSQGDISELGQLYRPGSNESAADYMHRLANEYIAKSMRSDQGFWRSLVERTKVWLAQHGVGSITNEEAARAILRKLAADKNRAPGTGAERHSLAPLSTEEEFRKATSSEELSHPEDALFLAKQAHVENDMAMGHVLDGFNALPPEVRAALPMLQGRADALNAAKAAADRIGGAPWTPATGPFRKVVEDTTPDPNGRRALIQATASNVIELTGQADAFDKQLALDQKALTTHIAAEKAKLTGERMGDLATEIVNFRRGTIKASYDAARSAGNDLAAAAADSELKDLVNRQSAVAQVLQQTISRLPKPLLDARATTDAQALTAMQAELAKLPPDQKENAAIVDRVLQSTPELKQRLLGIVSPEDSPKLKAERENVAAREQGQAFLRSLIGSKQFRENYEGSLDLVPTPTRARITKANADGEYVFENPADHTQSVNTVAGQSREAADQTRAALEQAQKWGQDYLDPAITPNPDPLKVRGVEAQIKLIGNILLSQQFNPSIGRLKTGGWNPFTMLMRMLPGIFDIPEFAAQMPGGRLGSENMRALAVLGLAMKRVNDQHIKYRLDSLVKSEAAAKAHGLAIEDWRRQVAQEILGSYQGRGYPRIRTGDSVWGHKVSAGDMDAVRAMKDYADRLISAVRKMAEERGVPVLISDKILNRYFEREAVPTSELTMPQALIGSAEQFIKDWQAIADKKVKKGDTAGKAAQRDKLIDLLDGKYYEPALIGHIRGSYDPDYSAMVKSPYRADYIKLRQEHDATGQTVKTVDELAHRIFDARANLPPDQQPSLDDIQQRIVDEIRHSVNSFTADRNVSDHLLDTEAPMVKIMTAENFMNRPRGKRLLPQGFYVSTLSDNGEQSRFRFHVLSVFAQRHVNQISKTIRALRSQLGQMKEDIDTGNQTKESLTEQVKQGDNFLDYSETNQALVAAERQLAVFQDYLKQHQTQEEGLWRILNIAKNVSANAALQNPSTMITVAMTAPYRLALLESTLLQSGRRGLAAFGPIGATWSLAKAQTLWAKNLIDTTLGTLAAGEKLGPKAQELHDYIKRNAGPLATALAPVMDYVMRQKARIEYERSADVIEPDPWRENLSAIHHLFTEGSSPGQRTADKSSRAMAIARSGAMALNEIGLPLQLPRGLGISAVGAFNNSMADVTTRTLLGHLAEFGDRAFKTRSALGYEPANTILTPQEIFGTKRASPAAAAELRQLFDRAQINFDRMLIEYRQAKEAGKVRGDPIDAMLKPEQYRALMFEMAKYAHKQDFTNRPIRATQVSRLMGLFYGFLSNQNAQMARTSSKSTIDSRSLWAKNGELFTKAATILFLSAVVGDLADPAIAWLKKLFFNEEPVRKPVWQARTLGEAGKITAANMLGFLPLLGRIFLNTIGAAAPGSQFSNSGLQLFPLSAAASLEQAISKAWQTGAWDRAFAELSRRFLPNSKAIINRLPMMEGATTERNVRNLLTANAPTGVETKGGQYQTGQVQYSPARGAVDDVINALSRDADPDMATVRTAREEGIQALIKAGKTHEDATLAFDRSIIAHNPFVAAYGRNLTPQEMIELRKSLEPDQLAQLDRVEHGRQTYAASFGLNVPEFVKEPSGGSGPAASTRNPFSTGGTVGIRTGGGSGTAAGVQSAAQALSSLGGAAPRVPGAGGGARTGVSGGGGRLRGVRSAGGRHRVGLRSLRSRVPGVRKAGIRAARTAGLRTGRRTKVSLRRH